MDQCRQWSLHHHRHRHRLHLRSYRRVRYLRLSQPQPLPARHSLPATRLLVLAVAMVSSWDSLVSATTNWVIHGSVNRRTVPCPPPHQPTSRQPRYLPQHPPIPASNATPTVLSGLHRRLLDHHTLGQQRPSATGGHYRVNRAVDGCLAGGRWQMIGQHHRRSLPPLLLPPLPLTTPSAPAPPPAPR